jgi:glycosyltransferase involved in cell wall biosynthesis
MNVKEKTTGCHRGGAKKHSSSPVKKRVLFAARRLWGHDGVTLHLRSLAEQLLQRNFEVALVSGTLESVRHKYDAFRWFDANIEHYHTPFPDLTPSLNTLTGFARSLRDLRKVINDFSPSIIHSHSLSLSPYFGLIRLISPIPLVSSCHIEFASNRPGIRFASLISHISPAWISDHMIAKSQDLFESFIEELNFDPEDISKIYYGIDDTHYRPPNDHERCRARRSFNIEGDDFVVCLVGRFNPVKGHAILFDALQILNNEGVTVHAICAGTGDHMDDIKQQAARRSVSEQIVFPGFVDPRNVYWASDVNVLPSYREGFAMVIPEAMLCGIPAIRTPAAGAKDQIDEGQTGYVVPFDSPQKLAERIRYLLEHPEDRSQMGSRAHVFAMKHFTLNSTVSQTLELYINL